MLERKRLRRFFFSHFYKLEIVSVPTWTLKDTTLTCGQKAKNFLSPGWTTNNKKSQTRHFFFFLPFPGHRSRHQPFARRGELDGRIPRTGCHSSCNCPPQNDRPLSNRTGTDTCVEPPEASVVRNVQGPAGGEEERRWWCRLALCWVDQRSNSAEKRCWLIFRTWSRLRAARVLGASFFSQVETLLPSFLHFKLQSWTSLDLLENHHWHFNCSRHFGRFPAAATRRPTPCARGIDQAHKVKPRDFPVWVSFRLFEFSELFFVLWLATSQICLLVCLFVLGKPQQAFRPTYRAQGISQVNNERQEVERR